MSTQPSPHVASAPGTPLPAHDLAARKAVRPQGNDPKPVSASRVTLAHIMSSSDTNLYGTVHGGVVMKLVDDAAAAAAARHAGGPAVTASIDGMRFLEPALVGDLLRVDAVLVYVGRTSMDVRVSVTAQRWNEAGADRHIVHAYLTFVAVDEQGDVRAVPPLLVETPEQEQYRDEALARRERRG